MCEDPGSGTGRPPEIRDRYRRTPSPSEAPTVTPHRGPMLTPPKGPSNLRSWSGLSADERTLDGLRRPAEQRGSMGGVALAQLRV